MTRDRFNELIKQMSDPDHCPECENTWDDCPCTDEEEGNE